MILFLFFAVTADYYSQKATLEQLALYGKSLTFWCKIMFYKELKI
jgi:hypothetical protein